MNSNELTWLNNFRSASIDSLYLGDDLAVQAYSESLERSLPALAYAVYRDDTRVGVLLGGLESVNRFRRLNPTCNSPDANGSAVSYDTRTEEEAWRHYCLPVSATNIRGEPFRGAVFLGFNLNLLDQKLESVVRRLWANLFWWMLIVLIIGLSTTIILAGKLVRRIEHLTEGAKMIGEGNLETAIPVESNDELGFLAHEFNLMASKLKELDQLKDDFVSSVSHELRSPLSAISGYVELLRSKPLDQIMPEKREKALMIIQESTGRLTHFINDILDLAKLEAGQSDLRLKPVNIPDMASDIQTLFQPLFDKKSIQCTIDVPSNVPVISADETKVRQVLTNLVSNALKFTPSGGKIRMFARNQTDFIQVSVQDTGVGIPEEAKETIFAKFRQAKNGQDVATGQKGTGLGLAIARGNVEMHGGRIWIESDIGKGTTVHFTLPIKQEAKPS